MRESNLSLVKCKDKKSWDDFVRSSAQGAVFCQADFLDALDVDYELWQVREGDRVWLGAIVLRDREGKVVRAPYDFSLYHGVLLDRALWDRPAHSLGARAITLVTFLLESLAVREELISFCLHHAFRDIRAFSWFNYHTPQAGQFTMAVRYTGLIDLAGLTFDSYLAGVRKSRRQEWRRAKALGFTTALSGAEDVAEFIELYRETFGRQGVVVNKRTLTLVENITRAALADEYGELMMCRSSEGEPAAATLFLHDERGSYYLYGASAEEFRNNGVGTLTLLESIRLSLARESAWLDVGGMNSPKRGDYKMSFNAVPTPFYVANWERVRVPERYAG